MALSVSGTAILGYQDISAAPAMSVTLPANCAGILVLHASDETTPDHTVTFDPGGANEVVKSYASADYEIQHHESSNFAAAWFFTQAQLPAGGGTFNIQIDSAVSDFVVAAAIVLDDDAGNAAAEVVQTKGNSALTTNTVTGTFDSAIQSASLVAQIGTGGSSIRTHTFDDLATELVDGSDNTFAGNGAAIAYEIGPVETQAYIVNSNLSHNRFVTVIVEVALAAGVARNFLPVIIQNYRNMGYYCG